MEQYVIVLIGQLSLSLAILDFVTFAPTMQFIMRHVLRWNDPYIIPLEISFHHHLRNTFLGSFKSLFHSNTELTLASISQRLPYFATLKKPSWFEIIKMHFQFRLPFWHHGL